VTSNFGPAVFDLYRLDQCLHDKCTFANKPRRGVPVRVLTASRSGEVTWQKLDMSVEETLMKIDSAQASRAGRTNTASR